MSLTSGVKLGPYEVQSPLGAGGMGEVYRARDTRLDRSVAIKVLPSQLQSDPDLRVRFEREARAIASLQHPHICTLFDVGRQDATDYLVMEYLEGETLANRLQSGPLPMDQALKIAIQIADALEKAHRQGIIHRDLKPSNIMLTKSGAKLMDFGLAKGRASAGVASLDTPASPAPLVTQTMHAGALDFPRGFDSSNPGTQTMRAGALDSPAGPITPGQGVAVATLASPAIPITQKGAIVGTFHYMAPEVLQGAEADARSDIFSFGCVLYEMTTRKRAFDGKSQVGVLAAILEKEPEAITVNQPFAPPAFDRLIRTCLAKDPEQRWQSVHDLKLQLEAIAELGSAAGVPAVVAGARRTNWRLLSALGAAGWVLMLVVAALAVYYANQLSAERQPLKSEIELPNGTQIMVAAGGAVISPDGHKLAFAARAGATNSAKIWIHDLEKDKDWAVGGTDGASLPFWSPDSRRVGFFANKKLRTVAATGGPVQIICDAPVGRGGSWSPEGVILFTPDIQAPLYKVSDSGGAPAQVTKLGEQSFSHWNPLFLPDGKHFLFTQRALAAETSDLYAGSLAGGAPKLIVQQASNAAYTQGYLLYLRDRNLVADRFDSGSLKAAGAPVPVVENVEYWAPRDLGNFSASPGGTLVFRPALSNQSHFAWLKLAGRETEEFGEPVSGMEMMGGGALPIAKLSSDGHKIVFVKRDPSSPESELWVYDIDHKTLQRHSSGSAGLSYAVFSPDGTKVAMSSNTGTSTAIKIKSLLTGMAESIDFGHAGLAFVNSWTPDGKSLIISYQDPKTQLDLYVQPVSGGNAVPLVTRGHNEYSGEVSPNGKWLAYLSNESGRAEIYVVDFPEVHSRLQISSEGANWHAWSNDGKRLYFANGAKVMAAEMPNPADLEFNAAEVVTMLEGVQPVGIAPDGRMLVLKPVGGAQTEPLHLVLHFPESIGK